MPDTKHAVPDTEETVPDTKQTVPDSQLKMPDTKVTVPYTEHAVPDTTHTHFALSHLLRVLFLYSLNYALFMVLYNRKSVENLHRYYA
jgi:hypothetical protein